MQQRTLRVVGVVAVTAALIVGGVALGLAVSDTAPASSAASVSAACGGSAPKLTVQGTGNASATPDLLTLTVDIAVTAVLKQGGIANKDIQTSNVSIQPQYNSSGAITGYQMTNTLTAQLHDFSRAGSVVDALTAAAGNSTRIDSLTFSIQDPRTIEDAARTDAVNQAVSHARSMAQAAGERLGPVCSLTDDSSPDYGIPADQKLSAAAAPEAVVPLQAGTQEVSAQITLVYALVQPRPRP